jgi:6-pyruvoyltetrahydropterin/6-carboxytetrahydropterin synthase
LKLGLIEEFDAAHFLPGYQGKCANLHGHTYQVEVVIEGQVGEDGMVLDFYQLKELLKAALVDLDHGCLNQIIPNPTAEKIALLIRSRLEKELSDTHLKLVFLKLWEGRNKWVMVD